MTPTRPVPRATDPSVLAIADVLTAYEISKRPKDKSDHRAWAQHELLLIRLLDLNTFFGDKMVSAIKAQICRDFVDWSTGTPNENNSNAGIRPREATVSDQTARRRLEDLRAAINAYHAEHTLNVVPKVTLPAKTEGRQRWLDRNEARVCSVPRWDTSGTPNGGHGSGRTTDGYAGASAGSSTAGAVPTANQIRLY